MKIYGIDASLRGFAHTVLDDGKVVFKDRIDTEKMTGLTRIAHILDAVAAVLGGHDPQIIVIEDYAFSAQTNNITRLAELGGVLKWTLHGKGYATGRDAILRGQKMFMVQAQSAMKKFCLGNGAMKKDSRYLLAVFERLKLAFDNDDEADAYMHAWSASILVGVIQGKVDVNNLTAYQRESVLERAAKSRSGLSITKALKLPEEERRKLAMELEVRS